MKLVLLGAAGIGAVLTLSCSASDGPSSDGTGGPYSNTGGAPFGGGGATSAAGFGGLGTAGASAGSGGTGSGTGGSATGGASAGAGGATLGAGGTGQGSGGVAGASGGATQGAGGGGGSSCQAPSGTGACESCAFTSCCAEHQACVADATCGGAMATFFTCLDQATSSGSEPDACDQAFTNGRGAADSLATCVHGQACSGPCQ